MGNEERGRKGTCTESRVSWGDSFVKQRFYVDIVSLQVVAILNINIYIYIYINVSGYIKFYMELN
jgi:hypothetical protein